jgi:hypothetical protein
VGSLALAVFTAIALRRVQGTAEPELQAQLVEA